MSLLFVDTNIWLDFYRVRSEAGIALLNHLDAIKSRLILTYQVEMEFKKHRQSAILDGFKALKSPDTIARPGLFSDAKTAKALQADIKSAEERVNMLKERLRRALKNPAQFDPVYQVCQRCFHKEDSLVLTRDSEDKVSVRERAYRRFLNGCPPRKANDTSMGDAVNWEWIVLCATRCKDPIHIVSRDADYGAVFENRAYLNDHLLQEFKERVSIQRQIVLHAKLSDALRHFKVDVTPAEEKEEDEIIRVTPIIQPTTELHRVSLLPHEQVPEVA
jgi:hypothetical protein